MAEPGIDKQKQWLAPSAALNRLLPPEDVLPQEQGEFFDFLDEQVRYGFIVGELGFVIGSNTMSEVMDPIPVYPLPNTPPWLLGLINLRGNLVPVFDLRQLLGLRDAPDARQMLLVLGENERSVGVLIDGLPQTPELRHKLNHPPPVPSLLREHVSGAYVIDGRPWLEFNHHEFFRSISLQYA